MSQKYHFQTEIKADNPFEYKEKIKAIEDIAKLDLDSLTKLSELSKSPKAIDKLKNSWLLIKSMVM
jgi:hypothetical protein